MLRHLLLDEEGAGLALQCFAGLVERGDQGCATGRVLDETDARLNLGQHAAGGEVTLLDVLAGLGDVHAVKVFLVGLVEVDGHLLHSSENHQHVGVQIEGQPPSSYIAQLKKPVWRMTLFLGSCTDINVMMLCLPSLFKFYMLY